MSKTVRPQGSLKRSSANADSYRIIDVNLNRSKEGLRVCEDIARFHLKDLKITKKLGRIRHRLAYIVRGSGIDRLMLLKHRDPGRDLGKDFSRGPKRRTFKGIFIANSQRVKESLRVLEEFSKLLDLGASKKIQRLRFDFYALEKETFERFPALLDSR